MSGKLLSREMFDHLRPISCPRLFWKRFEKLETKKQALEAAVDHAAPFRHPPAINQLLELF